MDPRDDSAGKNSFSTSSSENSWAKASNGSLSGAFSRLRTRWIESSTSTGKWSDMAKFGHVVRASQKFHFFFFKIFFFMLGFYTLSMRVCARGREKDSSATNAI